MRNSTIRLKRSHKLIIAVISVLWIINFALLWFDKEGFVGDIGKFGDMFGAVNSLFSGCAFVGIIISIRMQSEELELQRKELQETREEFKNQNFQTTFFNLLRTQREIINEFNVKTFFITHKFEIASDDLKGREFFRHFKKSLRKIIEALSIDEYREYDQERIDYEVGMLENGTLEGVEALMKYSDYLEKLLTLRVYSIDEKKFKKFKEFPEEHELEKMQFVYTLFFQKYGHAIGHYFRHFYHMLLFLEKSENQQITLLNQDQEMEQKKKEIMEEYMSYAEFLKSSLETPELVTLFYNSFNYPKAKRLLIKYNILDTVHVGNLLKPDHNFFPEYNLLVS